MNIIEKQTIIRSNAGLRPALSINKVNTKNLSICSIEKQNNYQWLRV
jgi:hypothetical protein